MASFGKLTEYFSLRKSRPELRSRRWGRRSGSCCCSVTECRYEVAVTRLSWCLRVCPGAAGWDVQSLVLCFPFTSLGAGRGLGASQGLWKHRPVPVWGSHRAHRCGMSPAGSGTWRLSPCPGHVPGVGGTSWVSCWVTTCTCACLPLPGALCCATAPSPHQRSEVIAPKLPFPAPALCKGLSAGAERSGFSSEVVSVGMRC